MITFELHGIQNAIGLTQTLGQSTRILDKALYNWGRAIIKTNLSGTDKYPPELPNQQYQRTGNLGGGWKIRNPREGEVNLVNVMPYAGEVVGEQQKDIHKNRWWIASEIVEAKSVTLQDTADRLMKHLVAQYESSPGRYRSTETGRFIKVTDLESKL